MTAITIEEAEAIVSGCVQRAAEHGQRLGVAVVDAHGDVLLLRRDPSVKDLMMSLGVAKAYTAAILGRPSVSVMDWVKNGSEKFAPLAALARHPLTPAEGGWMIKRESTILGGVGVTGGGQDEDRIVTESLTDLGFDITF